MNPTRAKRLARLERSGHPEVVTAYQAGQLSVRAINRLLRLSSGQQLSELHRHQDAERRYAKNCQRVVETIATYLETCQGRRPDLRQLRALLFQ